MKKNKFYITTPIFYTSGNWHLGHCYTVILCDILARYHRMMGEDVCFSTGSDEHGLKIEKRARANNKKVEDFVEEKVKTLKEIWSLLNISYDRFIRTSEESHILLVQKLISQLYEHGDIYLDTYSGWYCIPCETFWSETQLLQNKLCPDCQREVVFTQEPAYFFKLSKYAATIADFYSKHNDFIFPETKMREMQHSFLTQGLHDLCISRTSSSWGIKLPFNTKHTLYVWVDALMNYLSVLTKDNSLDIYWPPDLQVVGKEIVKFHAIIWPALLKALNLPLPKHIYSHGWLLVGGRKLSKSTLSNDDIEITDPLILTKRYGADALRAYLVGNSSQYDDVTYTTKDFLQYYNVKLVNNLSNFVARIAKMLSNYYANKVPEVSISLSKTQILQETLNNLLDDYYNNIKKYNLGEALRNIFAFLGELNTYLGQTKPWLLFKDGEKEKVAEILYVSLDGLRVVAFLLKPFMPQTAEKLLQFFNCSHETRTTIKLNELENCTVLSEAPLLFKRLDVVAEYEILKKLKTEIVLTK